MIVNNALNYAFFTKPQKGIWGEGGWGEWRPWLSPCRDCARSAARHGVLFGGCVRQLHAFALRKRL